MIQAPAVFGLLLTLAYLIGAIPFSAIIATFKGVDLRRVGSGNYGATNVYRALGLNYAIFVFLLDALKGTAVVYLTMSMFIEHVYIACFACFDWFYGYFWAYI